MTCSTMDMQFRVRSKGWSRKRLVPSVEMSCSYSASVGVLMQESVSQRFGARGHIWIKVCQLAAFSSELLHLVDKCGLNRLCVQPTGEREAAQAFCAERADPTASMVEDSAVTNKSWL